MTEMQTCPSCSTSSPVGFKFCPECATALRPDGRGTAARAAEERKVVTSLFCDLVGFTALSERHDPEDVDDLLRRYCGVAQKVVESYGGVVEKFIGDAVVAVFGVPAAHEDDPGRAVHAGLRILRELERLKTVDGSPLQVRIGVNTGEALVRLDVTPGSGHGFLTGDAVNTAARLQAAAPPMGVVVGESTYTQTQSAFEYRAIGPIAAKGKAELVSGWLAIAPRARTGLEAVAGPPFVGRTHELAALDRLFASAVGASAPRFVLLIGEAGIGKSRLVREFAALFEERSQVVIWRQGRCLPYGEGAGLAALAEVVKAHAGIRDSDEAAVIERKLEAVMPRGSDKDWVGRRVRSLVGLEAPEGSREESFASWTAFIEHLATEHPAILVLEDLHWADETMLAFVERLAVAAEGVRLLVLATARPELLERAPSLAVDGSGFARIDLDPLAPHASRELAAALWGEGPASAAEGRDAILARAGGNPFFLSESIKLALEEPGRSLPASVQAVIAARLDALPGPKKALLAEAAVIGHTFWPGALLALDGRTPDDVEEGLAFLVARQLIVEERASSVAGERQYAFWHALTREVAYGQLPRRVRLRAHVAAAGWIERAAGGRPEQVAEILAHHHVTALDLARSLRDQQQVDALAAPTGRYLALAGERAYGYDLATAERYCRRALEVLPPGRTRGRTSYVLGKCLCLSGRIEEGLGPLEEASGLLGAAGDRNAAGLCGIELSMWRGNLGDPDFAASFPIAMRLLDQDHPTPDLVTALKEASCHLAIALRDPAGAVDAADRCLGVAEALGHPSPPDAYVWRAEGRAALGAGDWMEDYERAHEACRTYDVGSDVARVDYHYTLVRALHSGPSAILEGTPAAVETARRRGFGYWVVAGRFMIAYARVSVGDWQAAIDEMAVLLDEMADSDLYESRAFVMAVVGITAARRGDGADQIEVLEWLLEAARNHLFGQRAGLCEISAAALCLDLGRIEEARACLVNCLDSAGPPPWDCACEASLLGALPEALRVAAAIGEAGLVRRFAEETRRFTTIDEHAAVAANGLLAELAGAPDEAAVAYADAAARWRAFGMPYEEAHALLGEGRSLVALGRPLQAKPSLDRAGAIFSRLGAAPALKGVERCREFLGVGARPGPP